MTMDLINKRPLLGLAVGDAFGAPYEMMDREDPLLRSAFPGKYLPTPRTNLKAGQWTDDTKGALCVAEGLLKLIDRHFPDNQFDYGTFFDAVLSYSIEGSSSAVSRRSSPLQQCIIEQYLLWFRSGDYRGMGGSTKAALAALNNNQYRPVPGAVGNGPATRSVPLGVMFRNRWDVLTRISHIDALVTHDNQEVVNGAPAVALGVAAILNGMEIDTALHAVIDYLPASQTRSYLRILERNQPDLGGQLGDGFTLPSAVARAFWAVLESEDFDEAIMKAIADGGDTDSVAALAGALAGALYGVSGSWREGLEDRRRIYDIETQLLQHSSK